MLNNVIDTLKPLSQTTHSGYSINSMIDWLKSLRPQNRWKPSKEHMECLHDAVEHYQTNRYPASKLNELYEQMSKIYKL